MVTVDYLDKVRRAVRRNKNLETDQELIDIIRECRLDLIRLGILEEKANDESDSLVLGAVRSFARWKFGLSNEDAELNQRDYMLQRDELRRSVIYCSATE